MDLSGKLPTFTGAAARLPEDRDCSFQGKKQAWPLIVTPEQANGSASLENLLRSNSCEVLDTLGRFGAILFRGFDVRSEQDFEAAFASVGQLSPIRSCFMSEIGRVRVGKAGNVFHTNAMGKSGGGSYLGAFHAENHFIWDVPAVMSFWCKRPSRIGGETAFVHSPSVYEELPKNMRDGLEKEPVCVAGYALSSIADRYSICEDKLENFLTGQGVVIEEYDDVKYAAVYKQPVWRDPHSGRSSLQMHTYAMEGVDAALRRVAVAHYRGPRWAIYRVFWRLPKLLGMLQIVPVALRHPLVLRRVLKDLRGFKRVTNEKAQLIDKIDDVDAFAEALWRNTSVLRWEAGDVVLFDNRQLLHSGMPGFGSRVLRVLMFNRVEIDMRPNSGILEAPELSARSEPLDSRLERFVASN